MIIWGLTHALFADWLAITTPDGVEYIHESGRYIALGRRWER